MGHTYVAETLIDALVATGSEPGIKFLKEQLKTHRLRYGGSTSKLLLISMGLIFLGVCRIATKSLYKLSFLIWSWALLREERATP